MVENTGLDSDMATERLSTRTSGRTPTIVAQSHRAAGAHGIGISEPGSPSIVWSINSSFMEGFWGD
jgi:hypothetical protein